MKDVKSLIVEHPFFAGMSEKYMELIADCGKNKQFAVGEFLLKEGEKANQFYVIRHGNVSLEAYSPGHGSITIMNIKDGSILGYSWLFPPYRVAFDARAITPVNAIEFDGSCLRSKAEQDHALGYELMKRFADIMLQRLQATRLQILDVYKAESTAACS